MKTSIEKDCKYITLGIVLTLVCGILCVLLATDIPYNKEVSSSLKVILSATAGSYFVIGIYALLVSIINTIVDNINSKS